MDNWVRIISFTYPHEGHLAKAYLEAMGVRVILFDEFTIQVHNFWSNAIGGVKLYVESRNAEETLLLLEDAGYIVKEWPKQKRRVEYFDAHFKGKCPYCDSQNVVKKNAPGYIYMLSIMLLRFPLPFLKSTYYCYDCSREWKISPHYSSKKSI